MENLASCVLTFEVMRAAGAVQAAAVGTRE